MTGSDEVAEARNYWRIARWTAAAALLLIPLLMMQVRDQWHWKIGSFILAGVLIGGIGLLYELAEKASVSRAYRAGAAIALIASLLTVWTTLVRDDGNGMAFFMLVMAAVIGGFAAWFGPAGMARTMLGVAIMQVLLGIATVTDPATANMTGGYYKASLFSGFFTLLWLISGAFFRAASRAERTTPISRWNLLLLRTRSGASGRRRLVDAVACAIHGAADARAEGD